jgi:hypothetical protein
MPSNTYLIRMIKNIDKQPNGCWRWVGAKSGNLGVMSVGNKLTSVKRLLYFIHYPNAVDDGDLTRCCETPDCVHPEHHKNRISVFLDNILKIQDTGCWEWQGSYKSGYGFFGINGKEVATHRFSYELYNGPINDGLECCHSCDNSMCCNPEHLFLGTHSDNMQDMVSKGRANKNKGERHHKSSITESDVKNILVLLSSGVSMKKIHEELNISYRIIQRVCSGESWSHVSLPEHLKRRSL